MPAKTLMRRQPVNRYKPDSVTPPGFFLDEKLNELGMSRSGLAARIQSTPEEVASIIDGQSPLSPATARRLERVLGIPAHFWNNAERFYRESLTRAGDGPA